MKDIIVSGSFDDPQAPDIAFLKAASELGRLKLLLWPDEMHERETGAKPVMGIAERRYFLGSVKFVDELLPGDGVFNRNSLPPEIPGGSSEQIWVMKPSEVNDDRQSFCEANGIKILTLSPAVECRDKFARPLPDSGRKKIIVTGCFDYFHTGHIRFFEEVAEHGDLFVVIGSDRNVELLKGKGHPHYNEDIRLFTVRSIKHVRGAWVSTGSGWMDAEPEIEIIKPDVYAVNEDGDKPEKREFCEKHKLQYLILKRTPKDGLPARSSTELRGF